MVIMTTDKKIKTFIDALGVQESKWRSLRSYHLDHKFNKEAEYIETKRRIIAEIKNEMESVFITDLRADGWPRFDFGE